MIIVYKQCERFAPPIQHRFSTDPEHSEEMKKQSLAVLMIASNDTGGNDLRMASKVPVMNAADWYTARSSEVRQSEPLEPLGQRSFTRTARVPLADCVVLTAEAHQTRLPNGKLIWHPTGNGYANQLAC